jgi:hypothetical protein
MSWTLVQSNSNYTSGADVLTCRYPSATSRGNLLVATVFVSMSTASSIADQGGNSWSQAVTSGDSPDDPRFADAGYIFYAPCMSPAGLVTVDLAVSASAILNIYEFAPPAGTFSALDQTDSGSDGNGSTNTGSASPDSGNLLTSTTNELCFGTVFTPGANGETCSVGAGWTQAVNNDTPIGLLCDMYQTAPLAEQGANATATLTAADNWGCLIASFTATSPPPPSTAQIWPYLDNDFSSFSSLGMGG